MNLTSLSKQINQNKNKIHVLMFRDKQYQKESLNAKMDMIKTAKDITLQQNHLRTLLFELLLSMPHGRYMRLLKNKELLDALD